MIQNVNASAIDDLQTSFQDLFSELATLQKTIWRLISVHADGKTLKGNELVGWLGEIYGKLLFDGKMVGDHEEHDFVTKDGRRVSVKTRKGWAQGWRQSSAIPKIEGSECPTHLMFVHLNDDYSVDRIWLFNWSDLLKEHRFKKHIVRDSHRSFIFTIHEYRDQGFVIYTRAQQSLEKVEITLPPMTKSALQATSAQDFRDRGASIRKSAEALVLDFMGSHPDAQPNGPGVRQAEVFRACGLDWGGQPKASSSNQQYWVVALLNQLKADGHLVQVAESGPWRRTQ